MNNMRSGLKSTVHAVFASKAVMFRKLGKVGSLVRVTNAIKRQDRNNIRLQMLLQTDEPAWLEEVSDMLRVRNFDFDTDSLADIILAMSRSDKRAVVSFLEQLMEHVLYLAYWPEEVDYCGNGWRREIAVFRDELNELLTPSLRRHLEAKVLTAYKRAKERFELKSGYTGRAPAQPPYALQQLLQEGWFPTACVFW